MEKNEYRYISNKCFWRDRTDVNYGVYEIVSRVDNFLLSWKSCSCLHILAQSVVVAIYELPLLR